jgi:hypothetical protein
MHSMTSSAALRAAAVTLAVALLNSPPAAKPRHKARYLPRPAYRGPQPALPAVPRLPTRDLRRGDAYTVWGASSSLRHPVRRRSIGGKRIKIRGVIKATNLPQAPKCAVHPPGKADPEGCRPLLPAFWLCDHDTDELDDCIQVVGWASNYAQIYGALQQYAQPNSEPYLDTYWGIVIPDPLPAAGAAVTVEGDYAASWPGASTGTISDPVMGILGYRTIEVHRRAPRPARLP